MEAQALVFKVLVLHFLLSTTLTSGARHKAITNRRHSSSKAHKLEPPSPLPSPTKPSDYYYGSSNIFDVLSFGAKGDGVTDDTQAFQATWQQACQVESAIFEVPAYFTFLVGPITFSGPCAYNIVFQVDGIILAPDDPKAWEGSPNSQWLLFAKMHSLILQGDGFIHGRGESWWSLPCKMKGSNGQRLSTPCDSPTAIRVFGSYNVTIQDLIIINSPQMHLNIDSCTDVQINNLTISSPPYSPNTDGIHIQNTQTLEIQNTNIENGDDCISIQTGTSDLHIHDVYCGSGHGISIGGLGKAGSQACVSNISVHDITIKDSQNGVRIKTWQGGSGSVRKISFRDITVVNISNPIIIDQYYCDASECKNQSSAVQVSEISYNNIKGTYNVRSNAMHFACSDTVPCIDINVIEVELLPEGGNYVDDPFCWNIYGITKMPTIPPVQCFQDTPPQITGQSQIIGDSC